jgi:RHS repeat-associated protein
MLHKNRLKIIITALLSWCVQCVYSQSPGFVQQDVIKVSGITNENQIPFLPVTQKQTVRVFSDGLGRPIQSVSLQASPLQRDIIQTMNYDRLGRQTTSYLPYVANDGSGTYRSNAATDQAGFYNNGSSDKVADDISPFSQQVFENSPLQRVLQSGAVGDGFQPGQHYKSISYRSNTTTDNVIQWAADGTSQGYYPANSLSVVQGTEEQGNQALSFTDLAGKVILKRRIVNEIINGVTETNIDTYYGYNNAGIISFTIPPKATATMRANGSWNLNQPDVAKLLFSYNYDDRGRLIEKTVPGAAAMCIVYDPLDRPVLMQDGRLRNNNQWNYIKYDVKGRAISQGIYTNSTYTTRAAMQTYVDGLAANYTIAWYEDRSSNSSSGYYTNNIFPASGIEDLSYAYYENYDLNQDNVDDYSYQSQGLANEETPTLLTRGMLTIVRKRTVGSGLSNIWLTNVMFYDKKGQSIQVQSNSQLNSTVSDTKTIVPDFIGVTQQSKVVKNVSGSSTTVLSTMTYDHMNRIKTVDQSYNGSTAVRIAGYTYNEIGQLVDKQLHSTDNGSTYLQSVDYRYNIRGQLLSINNSTLTNDGVKNDDNNDVFGMEFLYDKVESSLNNSAYYNGLVSAVKWMAKTSNLNERSYKFTYDDQNRLINANYGDRGSSGGSWGNVGAYDEKNISFDHNGNIITLQRTAIVTGNTTTIDDLQYSYDGNQLNNVIDGSGGSYASLGFKNITGSTNTYTYDVNGSLTADPKKGLTLSYNILNRTDKITIKTSAARFINYTYDSGGILLRKQAYDNNVLQKTTDYIDGFVYENSSLSYFAMPEGRVRNTGSALKPEYMIADQQGNVRVSFEEQNGNAVVRQENSYYPFGLIMPNSDINTPSNPNKNLYNAGSEWQNDFGDMPDYYQTFYRNYDASLGRFVSIDPKADSFESLTAYQYGGNNPVMFNDPLGDIMYAAQEYNSPLAAFALNDGVSSSWFGDNLGGGGGGMAYNPDGLYGTDPALAWQIAQSIGTPVVQGQFSSLEEAAQYQLQYSGVNYFMDPINSSIVISGNSYGGNTYELASTSNDSGVYDTRQALSTKEGEAVLNSMTGAANQGGYWGSLDWKGIGDATIGILGGVGEIATASAAEIGSEGLSTAVSLPLAIDGWGRVGTNVNRLAAYFGGNKTLGNALPSNIGGFVGKTVDIFSGGDPYSKGKGQAILGGTNDLLLILSPWGNAGAWQSVLETPNLLNSVSLGVSYYGGIIGLKNDVQSLPK